MPGIHPTACVERAAEIAEGRDIGPYCIVGPHVTLGPGCRLLAHVHVTGHTGVGAGTTIYPFASLGTPPQSTRYRGGATPLPIRPPCAIPPSVSLKPAAPKDGRAA